MIHGELFSGCGGLALGLERSTGARLAWHCQHDPTSKKQPCNEILRRHWPDAPNLGDISLIDWGGVQPVDVLAGGFPCQDVSYAGLRAGLADGNRSGLWFQFASAIRILRPRVVVVENVPGLFSAGFGIVMADLAEAGYHARWACLRASDLGAPHIRERIFIVATDAERVRVDTDGRLRRGGAGAPPGSPRAALSAGPEVALSEDALSDRSSASDTGGERSHGSGGRDAHGAERERDRRASASGSSEVAPDSPSGGWSRWPSGEGRDGEVGISPLGPEGDSSPSDSGSDAGDDYGEAIQWGVYGPAIIRWGELSGVTAPRPTDDRGRLSPEFVEWMLGYPVGWTSGVPRSARLKMLGNSVQVQCAEIVGLAVNHHLSS